MSDHYLRGLERRFEATSAREDQLQLLEAGRRVPMGVSWAIRVQGGPTFGQFLTWVGLREGSANLGYRPGVRHLARPKEGPTGVCGASYWPRPRGDLGRRLGGRWQGPIYFVWLTQEYVTCTICLWTAARKFRTEARHALDGVGTPPGRVADWLGLYQGRHWGLWHPGMWPRREWLE